MTRSTQRADELRERRRPAALARRVAGLPALLAMFDIVEVAAATERPLETVTASTSGSARGSSSTGCATGSSSCRAPTAGRRWPAPRCATTSTACTGRSPRRCSAAAAATADSDAAIDAWSERNGAAFERCLGMLADIKASRIYDTTTLPVALREVRNLIRGGAAVEA